MVLLNLLLMLSVQTNAQQKGVVQYDQFSFMFTPTNLMRSNIVEGTNAILYFDSRGRLVINGVPGGSGDAGGTNSRQFGSSSLTNLSGNPNVATNILGAGTVTVTSNNLGGWTITGAAGAGDAGGTNARQFGSLSLSNLSNNPYVEYTNIAAFQATSVTLTAWSLVATGALTTKLESNFWWESWGSLATNGLTGKLDSNVWNNLWGGLSSNSITAKLDSNVWWNSWGSLGTNALTTKLLSNAFLGNWSTVDTNWNWNLLPTNILTTKLASNVFFGNLLNNPYTGYTNLNFQVAANNVLSNIQTMTSFYWTNAQASSMKLSNVVGLADSTFTNVPLGGTNISVRTTGGTNFIDTIGELNNWSAYSTNVIKSTVTNNTIWLTVNAQNMAASNFVATNIQQQLGSSLSNKVMVGHSFFSTTSFTNLNGTGTLSNLANVSIPAHTLTNNGDCIMAEWHGVMASALANTNQFQIVYGSQTILDTGLLPASNTTFFARMKITRTGNTAQHTDGYFRWGPGGGVSFAFTNTNLEIAQTNGIATTLALRGAARRVGAHTNNLFQVFHWRAAQ